MRVFIKTYGCTLNQADSDMMAGMLSDSGAVMVGDAESADVVVVNTCTVKTPTEQKELHAIGKLEKAGKRIVVSGCMASANGDLIRMHAPSASLVTTSNIGRIVSAVGETARGSRVTMDGYSIVDKTEFFGYAGGVIAKIPLSEGCLSSCAFCETKFARGPLNSFPEDRIVSAVRLCAEHGAKEIQLTSQDVGAYGLDRKTNIAELMHKLSDIRGDCRIRIGMLNPEHLGRYIDDFADAMKNGGFYKFAHLPIQSGSNSVLRDMHRTYTVQDFNSYVERLRSAIPGITIETDIIVGFPTETEHDFEDTLDFVRATKPNVVNMCKFWSRPHAAASRLAQLPNSTISQRGKELTRVVRGVQRGINDTFIGNKIDVVLTEREGSTVSGRTESYKKVIVGGCDGMALGSGLRIGISGASCNVLYGTPVREVEMTVM